MHVSEGVRHWAAGFFGGRSFADVVTNDIAALVAGYNHAGELMKAFGGDRARRDAGGRRAETDRSGRRMR